MQSRRRAGAAVCAQAATGLLHRLRAPVALLVALLQRTPAVGMAAVGTRSDTLIAGFVVGGSTSKTVLIRASGPALNAFGVPGILADPQLSLYSGSALLGSNDGWGGDPQIAATASAVGGFFWGTDVTNSSAILITLPPGANTAQVTGASGDTGVALVDVYEVP